MSLGIHRLYVTFSGDNVKIRAQSQSARGTPFTVGHSAGSLKGLKTADREKMLTALIEEALVPRSK